MAKKMKTGFENLPSTTMIWTRQMPTKPYSKSKTLTTFESRASDLICWDAYWDQIKPRLNRRAETFQQIFDYLETIWETRDPVIVETGTYREENNYEGDGCSTLLFDQYVAAHGGIFWSVDNDSKACDLATAETDHAIIVCSDSVEFLASLDGKVDLLYLDSYNITDWNHDCEPAAHHLKELFAARHCLKPGTLVVIDDNIVTPQGKRLGKGRLVYELIEALGGEPYFDSYQVGWIWDS